jgi:hypothetical protein
VKLAVAAALAALAASVGCGGTTSENGCEDMIVAGDLVITEVFADADAPSGSSGADEGREWFEIYNATSRTIDLTGVDLVASRMDGTMAHFTTLLPVSIAAGDYLVLGNVLDDLKPAHVDYGYANSLGDLYNTGIGRIALHCGMIEIDRADYTDVAPGESRQLDGGSAPDYTANDDLARWCAASPTAMEFAPANRGTPGAANQDCENVIPGMCDDNGTLRATVAPAAGDLVITEVMPSPEAVGDDLGEWFEVVVGRDVDLNGVGLDRAGDSAAADVIEAEACLAVSAGDRVVFARSADPTLNGELPAVTATFGFSLVTGSMSSPGDVAVMIDTTVIDAFAWTTSATGASLQVDPDFATAADNDDEARWCDGTTAYGLGDLGTPGTANAECAFLPPPGFCDDAGLLRPIVNPVVGDVVITEVMPDPSAVSDTAGEWFEVVTTAAFDLNDVGLDRAGDSASPELIVSVACRPVTAGTRLVFAHSADPVVNGGLPAVDATFGFSLINSAGDVQVVIDTTVLDAVTWTASTPGASRQLDPDATDPVSNDVALNFCDGTTAYGAGDLGTPGGANGECVITPPPGSCIDGTTMLPRPIVKPTAGQVVISEWMPNPAAVADTAGEWIELLALASFDLNELQLGATTLAATPVVTGSACVPIADGGHALFARSADPVVNGMLPAVDGTFTFSLVNSAGTVQVGVDDVALDTRMYATTAAATSIQIDTDGTQCNAPATTPLYNGTDAGTPRAAHAVECP